MRHETTAEMTEPLAALVERVQHGEDVVILAKGKPVARLVAQDWEDRVERSRKAAQKILELGKTLSLGGIRIRELIDDGRR